MKRKILYMAVAVIAALSSCSNEDIAGKSNISGNGNAFSVTAESVAGKVTGKSTLTSENKVNWESTDKVTINGVVYTVAPDATDATKAIVTKESGDDPTAPYKAVFQLTETVSEGTTSFSLPASYTYVEGKLNMPMYAESETKDLAFQNVCGVLAVKVTNAEMSKVTSITVTSDKNISGTCTILKDINGKYYASYAGSGTAEADKTITLDCGTAGVKPTAEGTVFYLPLPVISEATLYVTVNGEIATAKAAEYKDFIYTQSMKKAGVTIARNTIYNADFKTSLARFSVAASGDIKSVNFTNGNLWSDASGNLSFEANQTDYPKTWNEAHIGHFYWTVDQKDSYSATYPTGITPATNDKPWFAVNGLRALTGGEDGEYNYLITTRGESLYKLGVTVGEAKNCLIIAPDNFVGTLKESYSSEAELKAYGLVCLPAAGTREGEVISGDEGYCWSAAPSVSSENFAYGLSFGKSEVRPTSYNSRSKGSSLRLVKNDLLNASQSNQKYVDGTEITDWE